MRCSPETTQPLRFNPDPKPVRSDSEAGIEPRRQNAPSLSPSLPLPPPGLSSFGTGTKAAEKPDTLRPDFGRTFLAQTYTWPAPTPSLAGPRQYPDFLVRKRKPVGQRCLCPCAGGYMAPLCPRCDAGTAALPDEPPGLLRAPPRREKSWLRVSLRPLIFILVRGYKDPS